MQSKLRVFVLGLMWAAIGGGVAALVDYKDWLNYNESIDWWHIEKEAIAGAVLGVGGFVRKQLALYRLPPGTLGDLYAVSMSAGGRSVGMGLSGQVGTAAGAIDGVLPVAGVPGDRPAPGRPPARADDQGAARPGGVGTTDGGPAGGV